MIRVLKRGGAWNVLRDGKLVQEQWGPADVQSSGVHETKGSAVRYAHTVALKTGEPVEVEGGEDDITD